MSKVQYALIREGNVSFGIVVVQDHVIDNRPAANQAVQAWSIELGVPTILLGARRHKLYGRPDIVRFMSRIHISRIPWREANIAA